MSIFKKKNYAEIGKTAPADQFSREFRDASSRKRPDLLKGAVEAFRAGNPQNIHEALSGSQAIDPGVLASALRQLLDGKEDKAAGIDTAFAKAPEESKRAVLTKVLKELVSSQKTVEESFVVALLKSGADANAEYDGHAGALLAYAAKYQSESDSISDLLFKSGASIDGALNYAHAKAYPHADIKKLEGYLVKETEKPAATETDMHELLLQVQGEVRELAEKMDRILSRLEASDAAWPEETKPSTPLRLRP